MTKVKNLVLVNDELESIDLERALDEVSAERRAHALEYRLERDRRLSVAVYLLLKEALWQAYGIVENPRIERGANGKPFMPDHLDIHFNLSHCPKAVACIVSNYPVGIDVEEIAPIDWEVAHRVLSEVELSKMKASSEPEVTFASYWTRKEALVKMSGEGIGEKRLVNLLASAANCTLETTVNHERGYVVSTALTLARRF